MSTPATRRAFWQGLRDGAPFLLVVGPFALLFGVAATAAGLDIVETMAMTALVVAGASQFTALTLMQEQAPTLIVIFTALAVNMRMALYSASLAPYLGQARLGTRALAAYFLVDGAYTLSAAKYEREEMTLSARLAYFFAAVLPMALCWYALTWVGAVTGQAIPESWPLDFALPITFIAIVAPMLRRLPHLVAAFVSINVTLALSWMPYSLGLIVAAFLAMAAGAMVEAWQERQG
ncbi:MAG: AzlC family ABC transporter permease [Pseudomonadota bacterium]